MVNKRILCRYIPVTATNGNTNFVKVELYYSLGGINYFTYKTEKRGYYLSVSPVYKEGGMESYIAFSGWKLCLVECNRKSKGKENEAVKLFEEWTNEKIMRCFPEITEIDALPF